ncbi:putative transcription factor interactor and regulator CCHC(Zn) family [Helianthus annuus]|nr:putative transcription factor interactor and regulator CCHC(Zn) family [Helianthus annuus]
MPTKDQWVHVDDEEKIYPPIIKRPPGRLRKERIRANDEQRKKYKCHRCGGYDHQQKKCKKSASQDQPSTSKRGKRTKTCENN